MGFGGRSGDEGMVTGQMGEWGSEEGSGGEEVVVGSGSSGW